MIKVLALVAMVLDHAAIYFFPEYTLPMRSIGTISFPLFSWAIVQGAKYTRDASRYLINVLLCALATQPFWTHLNPGMIRLNDLFTLLAALAIILTVKQHQDKKLYFICLPLILINVVSVYILIPLLINEFQEKPGLLFCFSFTFFFGLWHLTGLDYLLFGSLFVPLALADPRLPRWPKLKPLFYVFYPMHFAFICFMR